MPNAAPEIFGMPIAILVPVVAAILAAMGYVAKQIIDEVRTTRAAERSRRTRLVTLLSYLRGSGAVFRVQAALRDRLHALLIARNAEWDSEALSYEDVFQRAYESFSPEERELHDVIRGYTTGGLKPLNEAMLRWLQKDVDFKLGRSSDPELHELATYLGSLEEHLLLWRAKYEAWILNSPKHALVYLADEAAHGPGFPTGIEGVIERALGAAPSSTHAAR